jgi:hypothetical protein
MTDKESVDCCLAIVQLSHERRKARESFEWKLSIALWTLIVLAIDKGAVAQSHRSVFAALVFGVYFIFAVGLAASHAADGKRGRHYLRQASTLLNEATAKKEDAAFAVAKYGGDRETSIWCFYKSGFKALRLSYGALFQCLTTALLLAAFVCR